tara:strand:- start:159 stop:503 length:345 start_codon:yes stop_codon:yes gene_type:complete
MKDQNAILENESPAEKRDRARSLFLESLLKPDHALRGCAHNQKCYNELMEIRDEIVEYVKGMRVLKPGEKNDVEVKSFNGISVTLLGGALGKHYMKDWTEEQVSEYKEWVSTNA